MRNKFTMNEYFMPKQYDLGTAEKDATDEIETPIPLAKGYDGLPKFNTLQDNQKKNLPQTLRTQVAFQQESLQYNNYQVVNFLVSNFVAGTAGYVYENFNLATAVGSSLNDTVMFSGISGGDNNDALYYNIVYANARMTNGLGTTGEQIVSPSFITFYPIQKIAGGSSAGGKIPVQISNTSYDSGATITSSGTEYGVQSFGTDIYQENAYYTQSADLKGIRCIGIGLKLIYLTFSASIADRSLLEIEIELGIDLKSGGSSY
tara:strand:+ start:217 stop:999 length:783 start_codon:yes stop_codon:yes gene_type:complete